MDSIERRMEENMNRRSEWEKSSKADLEAKVIAVNLTCRAINLLFPLLIERFSKQVGQKIMKGGNSGLTKKATPLIPTDDEVTKMMGDEPLGGVISLYCKCGSTSLWCEVKGRAVVRYGEGEGQSRVAYYEQSIYLGMVDREGVLTTVNTSQGFVPYKCDFSSEYILEKRKEVAQAKARYEDLKGELFGFGE